MKRPTTRAGAQQTPATRAIERLAKLAMAGTPVPRMLTTIEGIVAGWRAEDIPASEVRERIDALQQDVGSGVMAAEDYVAEADGDKPRAAAQMQVEGLTAVQDYLRQELEQS